MKMVQEGVEADGETFLPLAESHADTQPEPPLEAKQDTSQHHHSSLAGAPSLSALLEQAWKEASDQVPAKPTPAKAKPSSGYDWDDDDDEEDMRTPDMRTPEPIQTSHERRVLATRSLDNVVEEEHEEEEEEQADVVVEREPEATDAHPDAYLQAAAAHWGAASYSKAEQGLQAAGNGHDGGQNGGVPAQHTPSSSSGDGSAYGSAFEDDLDDDEFNPQLDTSHRGGAAAGDVSGGGATAAVAIAAAVAGLTSASAGQLPLPPASAVLTTNSAPESSPPVLAQQQSQGAGMGVAAAVAGALPQAPPPPADIDAWQCLVDLPLHITARVFAFAGISPLPLPGAGRVFKRMLQLDETCAIWLASRYGLCEGFARAAGAGRGRLMAHLMALGAGQDQETLGAALEAAAGNGQEHVVDQLLALGAPVHANNDSPLRAAAGSGHVSILRSLLAAGADVHAVQEDALRAASAAGSEGAVDVLLAAGANPAASGGALTGAAKHGHVRVVGRLLAGGAGRNADILDSALCAAAGAGHADVVSMLLQQGGPQMARDSALMAAVAGNQPQAMQVVLDDMARRRLSSLRVYEALCHAAASGYTSIVVVLLAVGAAQAIPPDAVDQPNGEHPVVLAARNGCEGVLEVWSGGLTLAAQGAALRAAASIGHLGCVSSLLRWGNKTADDALVVAASGGHTSVVRHILAKARIAVDVKGGASLRAAAAEGHEDTVVALLGAGASEGAGEAMIAAASHRHVGVVRRMLAARLPSNPDLPLVSQTSLHAALERAAHSGDEPVLTTLLEAGAGRDSNALGAALVAGASQAHVKIVSLLLEAGANPRFHDSHALMVAIEANAPIVVAVLVEAGANVNCRDGAPLRMAADEGYIQIVALLVAAGAARAPYMHDATPLELAATAGHEGVAESLIVAGGVRPDEHGGVALVHAAAAGRSGVVGSLVRAGAKEGAGDALVAAAQGGHLACVCHLLVAGVAPDVNEGQALVEAVEHGHEALLLGLIGAGARVGVDAALMRAALRGSTTMARHLLAATRPGDKRDKGEPQPLVSKRGLRAAIDAAANTGHEELAEMLAASRGKSEVLRFKMRRALGIGKS